MFDNLNFKRPKVHIYFEDDVGLALFKLLIRAYMYICNLNLHGDIGLKFRNLSSESKDFLINKLKEIGDVDPFLDNKCQALNLGCELLISVNKQIKYFKRTVIVLDGDARIKETKSKPKIVDYVSKKFSLPRGVACRNDVGGKNSIFLPDFFAPESYLYRILRAVIDDKLNNMTFWRGLDANEDTSIYTSDRINKLFNNLPDPFNNDDLKSIFKEVGSEVWSFIEKSDVISYYYCDVNNVRELLDFIKSFKLAYQVATSELNKVDIGC